ncbi:MAG: hypothetical protein QF752_10480 [Planctomycetota bacterium]|nr:hypothetical protein [Planctomycetota bacterium]
MTPTTLNHLPHVCGHQTAIDGLLRAFTEKNLPPAIIFSGPKGVGKRHLAQVLASTICCPNAPEQEPEPCPQCQRMLSSRHPDLLLIQRPPDRRNISIKDIRSCLQQMQERPWEAPYRIAIIDGVEDLSLPAANCLLKSLEEPQTSQMYLLITQSIQRTLATIRSRCTEVPLGPIPENELIHFLQNRHHISLDQATQAAQSSKGIFQLALESCDQELRENRKKLFEHLIRFESHPEFAETLIGEMRGRSNEEQRHETIALLNHLLEKLRLGIRASFLGETFGDSGTKSRIDHAHWRQLCHVVEKVCEAIAALTAGAATLLTLESLILDLNNILPANMGRTA